jgi:hypothetical protein
MSSLEENRISNKELITGEIENPSSLENRKQRYKKQD